MLLHFALMQNEAKNQASQRNGKKLRNSSLPRPNSETGLTNFFPRNQNPDLKQGLDNASNFLFLYLFFAMQFTFLKPFC